LQSRAGTNGGLAEEGRFLRQFATAFGLPPAETREFIGLAVVRTALASICVSPISGKRPSSWRD
jgi:hypothetical protein